MMNIKYISPSAEMVVKLQKAREDTRDLSYRKLRCAYCKRNTIIVFEDAKGHISQKCPQCKTEAIYNVVSMRKIINH